MSTEDAVSRLLACQREMYAGGPTEALEEMPAPAVVCHVPGRSPDRRPPPWPPRRLRFPGSGGLGG